MNLKVVVFVVVVVVVVVAVAVAVAVVVVVVVVVLFVLVVLVLLLFFFFFLFYVANNAFRHQWAGTLSFTLFMPFWLFLFIVIIFLFSKMFHARTIVDFSDRLLLRFCCHFLAIIIIMFHLTKYRVGEQFVVVFANIFPNCSILSM